MLSLTFSQCVCVVTLSLSLSLHVVVDSALRLSSKIFNNNNNTEMHVGRRQVRMSAQPTIIIVCVVGPVTAVHL